MYILLILLVVLGVLRHDCSIDCRRSVSFAKVKYPSQLLVSVSKTGFVV